MDYEEAKAVANRTWGGLYNLRVHRNDTDGVIWQVTLHAPDGPVHFVKNGAPYCHASHGCNDTQAGGQA